MSSTEASPTKQTASNLAKTSEQPTTTTATMSKELAVEEHAVEVDIKPDSLDAKSDTEIPTQKSSADAKEAYSRPVLEAGVDNPYALPSSPSREALDESI